jgi:hypothetical protein
VSKVSLARLSEVRPVLKKLVPVGTNEQKCLNDVKEILRLLSDVQYTYCRVQYVACEGHFRLTRILMWSSFSLQNQSSKTVDVRLKLKVSESRTNQFQKFE